MDIKKFFIRYRIPEQFIYLGDTGTGLFRIRGGKPVRQEFFAKGIPPGSFPDEMKKMLLRTDTGIILNSSYFVFNLLTFDKVPFRKAQRDELVNWRISKVFPENMDNYFHDYVNFKKGSVLSILLKRDLKEKLESGARSLGLNLTFMGSSTIEIINSVSSGKDIPDFLIESDGALITLVFFRTGLPIYIRKMRTVRGGLPGDEIRKTAGYIEKNYGFSPERYGIFSADRTGKGLEDELSEMKFKKIEYSMPDVRFLPGIK